MSDCKRNECGECLPDYRYFVNQQPAVFNTAQTVTIDCPVGYTCDSVDPVDVDAGVVRQIPDIPTYDPDQDPNCDTLCEINEVIIGRTRLDMVYQLNARASVQSDAVTVTCEDIGLDPNGSATYTLPAGTITLAYDPAATTAGRAQLDANQIARNVALAGLLQDINSGAQSCIYTDPAPTQVWTTGISETVLEGSINAFAGISAPYVVGSAVVGPGVYRLEDSPGTCTASLRVTVDNGFDPPYDENTDWRWYRSLFSVSYGTCGGGTTGQNINSNYFWSAGLCQTGVTIGSNKNVYADDGIPVSIQVTASSDLTDLISSTPQWTDNGSSGTLGYKITMIEKAVYSSMPLKVSLPLIHTEIASFPFGQRWKDSTDPLLPTNMEGRTYFQSDLLWTRGSCGASGSWLVYNQLGGKQVLNSNLAFTVRWNGTFDGGQWADYGLPDETIGGWYINAVLNNYDFGYDVGFSAYKVTGETPYGIYVVRPDCVVATMVQWANNVAVATASPLPSCTLLAQVLTADANGELGSIDGVPVNDGDIIMVKDEVSEEKNGIYTVTTKGSAGTPWALTRHVSLSTSVFEDSIQGKIWKVLAGSSTGYWYESEIITTIDTSPVAFLPLPPITITVEPL